MACCCQFSDFTTGVSVDHSVHDLHLRPTQRAREPSSNSAPSIRPFFSQSILSGPSGIPFRLHLQIEIGGRSKHCFLLPVVSHTEHCADFRFRKVGPRLPSFSLNHSWRDTHHWAKNPNFSPWKSTSTACKIITNSSLNRFNDLCSFENPFFDAGRFRWSTQKETLKRHMLMM